MSKKQWLVLLMLFLVYLLLGASIFYHIESRLEIEKVRIAKEERLEINDLLSKHYSPSGGHDQHEILDRITKYCGKSVHNYTEGETDPLKWDFYNSFYFAYTVVSTIGYGNLAPTNELGRLLMIFYALIGIPINGILLAQLGEFFGQVFVTAVRKYKSYKKNQNDYSKKSLGSLEKRRAGLAMQIFMYLIPGFVMFIFFPAFLFSHYEGWTYDEAVYYAFVTLTTIGFGDYVAGQDNTKGSGVWFGLYKTFLICWISFGLGYIVMIMTFIGRGMTSKKIARLEHKLAVKLKHTQSKIWQEFNEDVNYLRRVFNELQLSKVKRVYVDEYDYDTPPPQFPRSSSFPNLRELVYGGLEPPTPPHPRRRANSEVVPMEAQVARVVSETDLQRIDKHATFASHAMVQPAELLARLVNVLGYIPPPDDDEMAPNTVDNTCNGGVQGFSEKEILASEATPWSPEPNTKWKLGGDDIKPCRSRATSEVRLDRPEMFLQPNACEWTWSGPSASSKIQEIMRARKSAPPEAKEAATKSRFLSLGLGLPKPGLSKNLLPRWMRQLNGKKPSVDHSMSVNDVEASGMDIESASQPQTPGGRNTITGAAPERRNSYSRPYFTHTGGELAGSNLLEETSLADFLRALTALHSRVGAVPDEFSATVGRKSGPQRKLGTASLTPPKLPSLLTLFSPPAGHSQSQQNTITAAQAPYNPGARRFSLRTAESSGTSTPMYQRRATQAAQAIPRPGRRFSLRPVATPLGTPPQYNSYSSNPNQVDDRPSPPPYSMEPFVMDCPKKPLVQMEGAPGVSSPVAAPAPITGHRRFSLRPAQIGVPPAPSSSSVAASGAVAAAISKAAVSQPAKAIPRWKAGLLQRQISQKNMQRRVRAFSLSDVHSEESDRSIGISPLALHDNARTITSVQGQKLTAPKTVTIVSPDLSRTKSEFQRQSADDSGTNPFASRTFRRYNSDIESVSSRSSSHSSKSLDKDAPGAKDSSSSSSSSNSRKSSDESISAKKHKQPLTTWKVTSYDDYKWDFPPTEGFEEPKKEEPPAPVTPNDDILAAIVKESDIVTRRLSAESNSSKVAAEAARKASTTSRRSLRDDELQASASRKPSIVSIEPWAEAQRRKSSTSRSLVEVRVDKPEAQPEVRIDVPDDKTFDSNTRHSSVDRK
ncbi:open rectifier potassium channel protein 1 [Nasonia vitripennis]|uniref:Potassium channel domain-containing protein n=1 Tax=Nasonia vitripennis TaxID=7425 RepID=A0A7M7H4J3_NASVI|nr:open rectifier potassium channel protein 1 [Nasonia vitripennis]